MHTPANAPLDELVGENERSQTDAEKESTRVKKKNMSFLDYKQVCPVNTTSVRLVHGDRCVLFSFMYTFSSSTTGKGIRNNEGTPK